MPLLLLSPNLNAGGGGTCGRLPLLILGPETSEVEPTLDSGCVPKRLSTTLLLSLLKPMLVDGRGRGGAESLLLSSRETGRGGGGNASLARATLSILSVLWLRDLAASSEGLVSINNSVRARARAGARCLALVGLPSCSRLASSLESVTSAGRVGRVGDSGGQVDARLGGGFFALGSLPCLTSRNGLDGPATVAPAAARLATMGIGCTDDARICTCF